MRILHCCLAAFYIDRYGYQENILPRVHRGQGHEVAILASTETYLDNRSLCYVEPSSYLTEDGIPITRLSYSRGIPHKLAKKLRLYRGLYEAIKAFRPDIIFLHDCQFLGIREVARYARRYRGVRVYVDGHTDFNNSARNWVSKHILHGIIYRYCAQHIEPYVRKFYGVLPARVDFFQTMYGISAEKTDLLVLGAEDSKIDWERADEIRASIRRPLGISESDFVAICGGKIDRRKNIHTLMNAITAMRRSNVKLIVFGTPNEEMAAEIDELAKHECIEHVGWIEADRVYDYLLASDLAVFPGSHSVLWEQAVGVGLPCIFRAWEGMKHIDLDGNCLFLETGSLEEIVASVTRIIDDDELYKRMKIVAREKGIPEFSYSKIARRAIEA